MRSAPDLTIGTEIAPQTVLLPVSLRKRLRERSWAEGRSLSEIARQLFESYVNKFD